MLHATACGAKGFEPNVKERGWKEIRQQHSNSRRGKQMTHGILIYRMEVKE